MELVAEVLSTVDLGVVPKRSNSFGNEAFSTKTMEFMAMNVPVIVSRTRIDEYYFSDQMVQFFESDNAADLATKILELIKNPARRTALSTCSLAFIALNNWDVKKHEYLELVDRLAA
jgi:glycosyltransferase involved in cell wall biosynthesis